MDVRQEEKPFPAPSPDREVQPGEYWVVTVEEVQDLKSKIRSYKARFTFTDPTEAWECWSSASRNGFLANAEHTRDLKA